MANRDQPPRIPSAADDESPHGEMFSGNMDPRESWSMEPEEAAAQARIDELLDISQYRPIVFDSSEDEVAYVCREIGPPEGGLPLLTPPLPRSPATEAPAPSRGAGAERRVSSVSSLDLFPFEPPPPPPSRPARGSPDSALYLRRPSPRRTEASGGDAQHLLRSRIRNRAGIFPSSLIQAHQRPSFGPLDSSQLPSVFSSSSSSSSNASDPASSRESLSAPEADPIEERLAHSEISTRARQGDEAAIAFLNDPSSRPEARDRPVNWFRQGTRASSVAPVRTERTVRDKQHHASVDLRASSRSLPWS